MKNIPTVCYKLNTPIKIGERLSDTFLECYAYSEENAREICDRLNKTATDRTYFVDAQPMFY